MIKIKVTDFNLEATMDSGQVFGFTKNRDGSYQGVLAGQQVHFSQKKNWLEVTPDISQDIVSLYFDLHRDLRPLYDLMEKDEKLKSLPERLRGLRLIRQDPWQGLACFILSSNNNIKRIQGIWKNLLQYYQKRRKDGPMGFPSAGEVASSHEGVLRELGLGYRAPFLWASARFIASNPGYLQVIEEASYSEALERVIAFPGIGPKVADCVLLYAFQKYEAFPVDVWILRAMRKLYFNDRKISEKRVHQFAQKRWGSNAGYIQQYIFHAVRTGGFFTT